MIKNLLWRIHNPRLHPLANPISFPWGWMPPDYIHHLLSKTKPSDRFLARNNAHFLAHLETDPHFAEHDFCEGAIQAYDTIYSHYEADQNFFHCTYASPAMSLIINHLISIKSKILPKKPDIIKTKILAHWIEEDFTFRNNKFLGLFNDQEMRHLFYSGMIGPEMNHIWSQVPIKQIVKIHFMSRDREDVWYFERCLFEKNSDWQVQNINGILDA